jgi:hypothetical protein
VAVAKVLFATLGTNYQQVYVIVGATDPSNGSGGARIECKIVYNAGEVQWAMAKNASGSETIVFGANLESLKEPALSKAGMMSWPVWLRLRRSGSTFYAGISWDGVQYIENPTTTLAWSVATLVIGMQKNSADPARAVFRFVATA